MKYLSFLYKIRKIEPMAFDTFKIILFSEQLLKWMFAIFLKCYTLEVSKLQENGNN